MLHLILGASGTGKTYHVRQMIAEMARSGKHNLTLLVPEQNNYESERAMLNLLGSASTEVIEVTSFSRLVDWLEPMVETDAKPVADEGIKTMLMGRAVRAVKTELILYGKFCDNIEFCQNVGQLVQEFKRARVSTDDLRAVASKTHGNVSAKMHDLALMIDAYRGLLDSRFRDPLDDLDRLASSLSDNDCFHGRTVFIDAFKGFTEQQFVVLERVLSQAEDVYCTLCTDALQDNENGLGLFSNVKRTAARLVDAAHRYGVKVASPTVLTENHRFGTSVIRQVEHVLRGEPFDDGETTGTLTVCACRNTYDEADYVARTVRKLVRTQNYRFRDFAVIARDISEYQGALTHACERYGVPCFNDRLVTSDSLALMRFVLLVLTCVTQNYPTEAVLPLMKSPLSPLSVEQASALDNYVLMWNKHGNDWLEDWSDNPNGLEEKKDDEALARVNAARQSLIQPLQKLARALESGQVKSICYELYQMLIHMEIDRRLASFARKLDEAGDSYFADLHRQSWDVLMACLDNTVRALEGEYCEKQEFVSLFTMLLSSSDLGTIPDRLDEVVIGSADRIRIGAPRVVFVIGANYGVFPRAVKASGLLSNNDRRLLAQSGLAMRDYAEEHTVDEKFILYASLTGASESLYITYRNAAVKGDALLVSDFVAQCKAIPDAVFTTSAASADDAYEGVLPAIDRVCSDAGRAYADALNEQLRERQDARSTLLTEALSETAPKRLHPATAKALFGSTLTMSASRLNDYVNCPFQFFCKSGLHAEPTDTARYDDRHKGTLMHYVYENTVKKHGRRLSELSAQERMDEICSWIRTYSDAAFGGYDALDSAFLFLLDQTALALDDTLNRIGQELSESRFVPDQFELKIGANEAVSSTLPLSDGAMMLLGSVDRVDIYQRDDRTYVRVLDYKNSSREFDVSHLLYGMNMQMLLYLFSITESSLYTNPMPAGALYVSGKGTWGKSDEEDVSSVAMTGLLVDEPDVIDALDPNGTARFLPYNREKPEKSSALSAEDFDLVRRYVKDYLVRVGDRIHDGDMDADPLAYEANKSACKWCDYRTVCLRTEEPSRILEKKARSEAVEAMRQEVSDRGI